MVRASASGSRKGLLAALVILLLAAAGCGGAQTDRPPVSLGNSDAKQLPTAPAAGAESKENQVKPIAGYIAPEIVATDVFSNEKISLSNLKGQVVLINFWATWCGPCRVEMPDLEAFHKETQGKVRILAVGADDQEDPQKLGAFAKSLGLTFTIAYDGGEGMQAYRVFGIPTSVFVDKNGRIRARHTGPLTLEQMRGLAADTEKMGRQQQ